MFLDLKKRWKYIEEKGLDGEGKPANKYTAAVAVLFIMLVFLLFSSPLALLDMLVLSVKFGVNLYHLIGVAALVILVILMTLGKAEKTKK